MPILFNASLQTTSDDSSLPKLNTSIIPNTRSRATTLTTHSLHHLKKETLQLQQQQQQDSRNSSGKHSISISCSSSSSASSPSSSISSSSSLSSSIECNPHCKSSHSSSSSSSIINNKDTITVVTPAPAPRHSRARRNSTEERDNDNLHHPYQLKQRGYDRTTPSLSPSPSLSLSPPPSSPTSSIDSSDSISDNHHRLHLHHIIYEVQETKSLKDDKSFPLSPPASATTSLPPPSILSNTTVLCSTVSSPEGMDSEEIPSHDHHQKKVLEIQNQLDNYSVGKRTNTERSSSTSSNSSLAPSSLWISSSKGRSDESQQQLQESEQDKEDEPRAKRKRSMASLEQSPLSFENDKQIIKGVVVCPLSPPSSNSTTTLSNDEVSITDNNNSNNNDDDAIIIVAASPKLETVFEGRESCSETTTTTTTTTKKALSDTNNIPAGETGSSILGENSQPDYSTRPPISYAGLIIQVLRESTKIKMTLADIYSAIMQKHPYYRYAASGWQNSVRNSLSLNKAFAKIDRTPGESGHGCFWALQDHVRDSTDPLPCRKRKAPQSDTTSLTPTARSKGSSLPKLDCVTDSTSDCTTSFLDSAPSPAASEDAEDLKSPRRSGRARRPPRPKEAEDYIGPYPRQPSLSNASLSTPPSSPAPHGQDREVTPVAASARRRASSVKVEKIHPHLTHSDVSRDETTANRKAIQDADLASIPGVVTTQRIRRPPQNLAEFVSSEDFKAAPCGKRQERTLQSSASSSLNGSETESTPRERKEAKRSKSESHISYCHSGKRSNSMETDQPDADPNQPRESFDRSPSMPDLAAGSRLSHSNPTSQPATIPLSALSHSKCLNSKKQRRDSNSRPKSLYSKRHSSHEVPTRQQILERRRREGKREIMVASEDDWSDSDFDFLRDEEENYRMMRIRVRKIQRTCGRWSLRDNTNDDDGFDDAMEDEGFNSDDEQSRVEGEKIKLLMDPSVINYGFDSCDSKYILDFHQGPLFNNVTWPEFSDVKEDSNNGSNGNGNRNPSDSSNPLNNNSNTVHGRVLNSVTEEILHEVDQVNIDAQSVAEVLSELTKSVVLGSESIHPTECIPIIQEPTALPLPLITPSNSTNGEGRKQEAEEWALFVGNCGPKMECNTGASHRNMEIESETKLKDIISPLEEQQHVLPDSEIEAVVAAVASGAVADKSHAQMEDIITQVTSPIVVVKEEIEAENFIGWSLCE